MTRCENEAFRLLPFLLPWSKLGRQLQGGRIYLGSCFQAPVPWAHIWAEHHGGNRWQRMSFHSMHDQEARRWEAARNNMSSTICSSGLLPTDVSPPRVSTTSTQSTISWGAGVKTQSVGSMPHWNPITSWWCAFSLRLLSPIAFPLDCVCCHVGFISCVSMEERWYLLFVCITLHFVISSLSCPRKCFLSPPMCFLRLGGSNLHLLCNAAQGNSTRLFWTSCPSHLVSNLTQHPKQPCNSSTDKSQRRWQGSNYKQNKSELYN